MKKKSIFVVALAALMLIAFTACEQPANIWNPNGKVPTNAVITQTGDWFVSGQTFDPSRFSVAITYADGSSETVSGTNLVQLDAKAGAGTGVRNYVLPGDGVKATVGTTTVTSGSATAAVNATGTLNVASIDSVTITGPAEKTMEAADKPVAVSASEFTVSVGYTTPAGKQTMTLEPSDYDLAVKLNDGDVKFGNWWAGSYEITADVSFSSGTSIKKSDAFTLTVKEYEAPTEWDGTTLIVELADETATNLWKIGRKAVSADMVKVYQSVDGEKGEAITGYTVAAVTGYTPKSGTADKTRFNNAVSSGSIKDKIAVTYVYYDSVTGLKKTATGTSEDIDLRADYATDVTFAWKGSDAYTPGDAYITSSTVGSFTCTVDTWKSGYAPSTKETITLTESNVKANPEKAVNTTNQPQDVTITLTLTQTPEYRDSEVSDTVVVKVKNATQQGD